MQPTFRFGSLAFAVALVACPVRSLHAQKAGARSAPVPAQSSEPSLESKDRARTAYARGQAAFAQGDFATAKAAFEQAFASVPNPVVLLSIAECALKLQLNADALAAYDRYLQLNPNAADRADVERRREALLPPGVLAITTAPVGADVIVDRRWTGQKTPAELSLPVGEHEVQLVLRGHETGKGSVLLASGQRVERQITLTKRPEASPPPAAAVAAAEPVEVPPVAVKPAEFPSAALWLSGGIGAAGLIAGTVLGIFALKEHEEFNDHPSAATADRGERLALFSDVGFGVGAMALVTALVLYSTYDDAADEAQARAAAQRTAARLQLIPRVSSHSASATAQIRF